MPYSPVGYIEVREANEEGGTVWKGLFDATTLLLEGWYIDTDYYFDVFNLLFHYSAPGLPFDEIDQSLFGWRGFPADLSESVRWWHQQCGGSSQGDSWALWSELSTANLRQQASQQGMAVAKAWLVQFDVLASLARWYGNENVRLVVWWVK